jgi:hypothetical protein
LGQNAGESSITKGLGHSFWINAWRKVVLGFALEGDGLRERRLWHCLFRHLVVDHCKHSFNAVKLDKEYLLVCGEYDF